MRDFEGKIAFITGGTSGIGLGIARAFAEAGMRVVIAGLRMEHIREALEQFAADGRSHLVHALRVDVTDRPSMERAASATIQHFGKVHVLVNNAGIQFSPGLRHTSYADWDRMIGVNLTGVFNGVHAFLPRIQAYGEGGSIVSTASINGLFVDCPGYGAYCTSKYAIVGMMEALRAELAGTNIGVSVFCPGLVRSNLEEELRDLPLASDPLEVGRLVLRGVRRNDLYILTHPEFEPIMHDRHKLLTDSILPDLAATADRSALARKLADQSIYSIVRNPRPVSEAR